MLGSLRLKETNLSQAEGIFLLNSGRCLSTYPASLTPLASLAMGQYLRRSRCLVQVPLVRKQQMPSGRMYSFLF